MDGYDNETNEEGKVAEDDPDGPAPVDATCEVHHLCSHCDELIAKAFKHKKIPSSSKERCILRDGRYVPTYENAEHYQEAIVPSTRLSQSLWELYTLHDSVESLRSSVESRCHLCTLIWERLHSSVHPRNAFETHDFQPITKAEKMKEPPKQKKHGKVVVGLSILGDMDVTCEAEGHPLRKGDQGWYKMRYYHKPSTFEHKARRFLSTASSSHQELARYWFNECLRGHPQCGGSKPGFRPTRLLFIPSAEASHIRLDIFNNSNRSTTYLALSHCWGGATDMLTLQKDNIEDLSKSVAILQRTIRWV